MDAHEPDAAVAKGVVARDLWLERDGGRVVLHGASIDVPRGQVTALLAPSGAGKSTLLRCLNRLLEPDRGVVELDGVDVRSLEPCALRRRVGLVAQAPVMLPGNVADNVAYALPGLPRERVVAALDAAGLDASFAERQAEALSGGEQARVAIARALAREPEVLLLDEPTAALDADAADRVAATLVALAADGLGICLATHDLALADRIADRRAGLGEYAAGGAGTGGLGGGSGVGGTTGAGGTGGTTGAGGPGASGPAGAGDE